ncbi:MAG: hypothetical protein KA184_22935 [Candidatus Hydrogenedentes bacterium]|nr:hypothetical protein [Candidatus Hydrogenedentota bacterium]
MPPDRVEIGRVRSVAPGRRELRIRPAAGYTEAFQALASLRVVPPGHAEMRCRVEKTRRHGDDVIAALAAGVPRDAIGRMKGAAVVAAPGEVAPTASADLDVAALNGFRVTGADGAVLGKVTGAYETPANAAFVVQRPDGTRFLLPAIPEVVKEVDLDEETLRLGDIGPYAVEA